MEKVILDKQIVDKLQNVQQKIELANERGDVVGYFVATSRMHELEANRKALDGLAKTWVTDEELIEAESEPATHTMDDVMKLLEKYS